MSVELTHYLIPDSLLLMKMKTCINILVQFQFVQPNDKKLLAIPILNMLPQKFQADVRSSWHLLKEVKFIHYTLQGMSKHFVIQPCISQTEKLKASDSKGLLLDH
jgi:hypothetical protein